MLGCLPSYKARNGARAVAVFNFLLGLILMMKCLTLLNPFYNYYSDSYYVIREQITDELAVFSTLFLISVLLYVNKNLKESTYDRKLYKISQWLVINSIFLSFYVIAFVYIVIKHVCAEILYYTVPVAIFALGQICIVKCFYDEEFERSADSSAATAPVVNQCVYNRNVNVTMNNPTSVPNPEYQVQTVQQPSEARSAQRTIYPEHHRPSPPPAASAADGEPRAPPEYCNPPAYSPSYDPQTGNSSVKVMYY